MRASCPSAFSVPFPLWRSGDVDPVLGGGVRTVLQERHPPSAGVRLLFTLVALTRPPGCPVPGAWYGFRHKKGVPTPGLGIHLPPSQKAAWPGVLGGAIRVLLCKVHPLPFPLPLPSRLCAWRALFPVAFGGLPVTVPQSAMFSLSFHRVRPPPF